MEAGKRATEASCRWRLHEEVERERARLGQREEDEAAAISGGGARRREGFVATAIGEGKWMDLVIVVKLNLD